MIFLGLFMLFLGFTHADRGHLGRGEAIGAGDPLLGALAPTVLAASLLLL